MVRLGTDHLIVAGPCQLALGRCLFHVPSQLAVALAAQYVLDLQPDSSNTWVCGRQGVVMTSCSVLAVAVSGGAVVETGGRGVVVTRARSITNPDSSVNNTTNPANLPPRNHAWRFKLRNTVSINQTSKPSSCSTRIISAIARGYRNLKAPTTCNSIIL